MKEMEHDWKFIHVNEVIEHVSSLHESKKEGKIIIADEFLQTIDIVGNALRATGIEFLEFDGHMPLLESDTVRARFDNPNDTVKVMLATIQCFSLGITLIQATHVFILTPRWNPAADVQAISRVHRIGQDR